MKKVLFLFIVLSIILFLILGRGSAEAPTTLNPILHKVSQYSDRHITQNATAKNEQFSQIAFAPVAHSQNPFESQMASVYRSLRNIFSSGNKNEMKEYGTWVWTPTLYLSDSYSDSILSNAKKEGINVVYLSVDSYLDIYVLPEGPNKVARKKEFSERLENFIKKANQLGIAVDAEAGWRNWAEPGHTYKPLAVVEYILDFNATHQSKFRGFQYDVEPYLLDSYKKNPETIFKNFLTLVDATNEYLEGSSLAISVVIPDFYDERDQTVPKIEYAGKKLSVFKHLASILEGRAGSSIIIMSYRNAAEGRGGSIDISQNEFKTLRRGFYSTKLIVAQETGEVSPRSLTFYGMPKKYFSSEITKLNTAFASHPNFSGPAIHYANAFLELK